MMTYFLLDTWDIRKRANQNDGFAYAEVNGSRTLSDLERCPICRKQVSPKKILEADQIVFHGNEIGDITYGLSSTFIVSGRFRESWLDSRLSGLTFTEHPLDCRSPSLAKLSDRYFFAYPQSLVVNFCQDTPRKAYCDVCGSSETNSLEQLNYQDSGCVLDCLNPSCLPGWTLISESFFKLVSQNRFLNVSFMEGFKRESDRRLTRLSYHKQLYNGNYTLFDVYVIP